MKRTSMWRLSRSALLVAVAASGLGCGLMYDYGDYKTGTGASGTGASATSTAGESGASTTSSSQGGGGTGQGGGTGGTTTMLGELGDACMAPGECKSGHCGDGVCCDSDCDGLCETCVASNDGTGTTGTCYFINDGQDPEAECNAPESDVCNGMGQCRCHDGVKNGTEVCKDCGGGSVGSAGICSACEGLIWACANACDTGTPQECCSEANCPECPMGQCGGVNGTACGDGNVGNPVQKSVHPVQDAGCASGWRCRFTTCECNCPP